MTLVLITCSGTWQDIDCPISVAFLHINKDILSNKEQAILAEQVRILPHRRKKFKNVCMLIKTPYSEAHHIIQENALYLGFNSYIYHPTNVYFGHPLDMDLSKTPKELPTIYYFLSVVATV